MKLALIRRQFSATGGAELYLQRLLEALAQRGHELHLFAETWTARPADVVLHSVKVSGTRAQKLLRFAEVVQWELAREKFDCIFSLERTLRQNVYRAGDGVHRVWLERRRQFAPWWKKPFVGIGAFHRSMQLLEAKTFDSKHTRHIIVNSEMVKREILQNFSFPAERIHLVRNGVDVARFQNANRAAARAHFGFAPDEYVLLFVGSGWERKGLKYALKAARAFQRDELVHVSLAEEINKHVAATRSKFAEGLREFYKAMQEIESRLRFALGGRRTTNGEPIKPIPKVRLLVVGKGKFPMNTSPDVLFAGPMTNVEQAYAAADLFVSLPIYEPSANVVIEALAAGLPVITTAYNGASELIEDGRNGTVVDDPSETSRVVGAIASWSSRRFYSPPIRAANLSLDRNVSETLAILEVAAKERAG